MIGDFEQDPRNMDPELAASIVQAYPDVCVGIKTAHYWTNRPTTICTRRGPRWIGRWKPARSAASR
ncbi:MAG: hypothetical protein R2873_22810 [Caldilineaceae bacterium]